MDANKPTVLETVRTKAAIDIIESIIEVMNQDNKQSVTLDELKEMRDSLSSDIEEDSNE